MRDEPEARDNLKKLLFLGMPDSLTMDELLAEKHLTAITRGWMRRPEEAYILLTTLTAQMTAECEAEQRERYGKMAALVSPRRVLFGFFRRIQIEILLAHSLPNMIITWNITKNMFGDPADSPLGVSKLDMYALFGAEPEE